MPDTPQIEALKQGTLLDLKVLCEYAKNIDKENPFTLDAFAILGVIRQIAVGVMKNINIVANYNVATKNKVVRRIVGEIEEEGVGEDDSEYYI